MADKYFCVNIHNYIGRGDDEALGIPVLQQLIADFTCPKNKDVEHFLKENAISFTRKNQSVTYLVFTREGKEFVGYFTLALKPLAVRGDAVSNTTKKKLLRISELDGKSDTYTMAAYLIAQLGKNYTDGLDQKISGIELLGLANKEIRDAQNIVGGVVTFLEAENEEKLLTFYNDNGFRRFDTRLSSSKTVEAHELVQLLRLL